MTFLFISMIILIIKTMQLQLSSNEIPLKPIGLRLNVRPYNKLDKGVIDFREYKEELIMPHNTKCFYLEVGTSQE